MIVVHSSPPRIGHTRVVCQHCLRVLEYSEEDVMSQVVIDFIIGPERVYFIQCPSALCMKRIRVRGAP